MPTTAGQSIPTPAADSLAAARAAAPGFAQAAQDTFDLAVTVSQPPDAVTPLVFDWYDTASGGIVGISPAAAERGQPTPLSWWQRRRLSEVQTIPQPVPVWLHSRPYNRGADAFAPKFGVLPINPIGAGVYAPYRIPTIAGPGARYVFGAIWFDVQTIPTSININPTIPIETMDALLATSSVGGTYLTTG